MKFALVIIVTLGLIALSQTAPLEESPMLEGGNADEAAMNELADTNCGPKGGAAGEGGAAAGGEGQQTQQQQDGKRQGRQNGNGKRKGGKGRGKKQNQGEAE